MEKENPNNQEGKLLKELDTEVKKKIANGELKYKVMPALLVDDNEAEGTVSHIVNTTGIVDDVGDITYYGCFQASIKANGPQSGRNRINALWMHDWNEPIGKPLEMRELTRSELPERVLAIAPSATGGLFIKTKLANTSRGRDAYALAKEGIGEWSIGFFEIESYRDEKGINHIKKIDLIEYSFVNRGANYATGTLSVKSDEPENMTAKQEEPVKEVSKDIKQPNTEKSAENSVSNDTAKTKAVVPYQNLPLLDEDVAWDGQQAEASVRKWAGGADNLDNMDWDKYKKAFVMVDNTSPNNVSSYKLQIATVGNGELKAVPRGVFAAATALQGARTPIVEFDNGDIEASKNHIKRYYDRMERTAPWERQAGLVDSDFEEIRSKTNDQTEVLTKLVVKAGAVLSARNRERLQSILQEFGGIVQSTQMAIQEIEKFLDETMPSQESNLVQDVEIGSTILLSNEDLELAVLKANVRSALELKV